MKKRLNVPLNRSTEVIPVVVIATDQRCIEGGPVLDLSDEFQNLRLSGDVVLDTLVEVALPDRAVN